MKKRDFILSILLILAIFIIGCTTYQGEAIKSYTPSTSGSSVSNLTNNTFKLTVSILGNAPGNVTGPGIDCGLNSDCTEIYPNGTSFNLTAHYDFNTTYIDWRGCSIGFGGIPNICMIIMDKSKNVIATFDFKSNQTFVDLEVSDIVFLPDDKPKLGDRRSVKAIVKNNDNIGFNYTFYYNINYPDRFFDTEHCCLYIGPGETKQHDLGNTTFNLVGNYSFRFGAYPVNYSDRNPMNNVRTEYITIGNQTYLCGDVNGDKRHSLTDIVSLINYIFKTGPKPSPLLSGDANGDKILNLADVTYLTNFIFKRGPKPTCGGVCVHTDPETGSCDQWSGGEPNCYCP